MKQTPKIWNGNTCNANRLSCIQRIDYAGSRGIAELLEQKRYSPSTIKTYRAYFSDFMEYHKGRNIDRLKVADINKYILYLVNEKTKRKYRYRSRTCESTPSSSTMRR